MRKSWRPGQKGGLSIGQWQACQPHSLVALYPKHTVPMVAVELTLVFVWFQRNSKKFWDLFPSRSSPDDLDFEVGGFRLQC